VWNADVQVADYFVDTTALEAFTNLLGKRVLGTAFFNGCQVSQGDAKATDCMPPRYEVIQISCIELLSLALPFTLHCSSSVVDIIYVIGVFNSKR
jgi:hypothetical protein